MVHQAPVRSQYGISETLNLGSSRRLCSAAGLPRAVTHTDSLGRLCHNSTARNHGRIARPPRALRNHRILTQGVPERPARIGPHSPSLSCGLGAVFHSSFTGSAGLADGGSHASLCVPRCECRVFASHLYQVTRPLRVVEEPGRVIRDLRAVRPETTAVNVFEVGKTAGKLEFM